MYSIHETTGCKVTFIPTIKPDFLIPWAHSNPVGKAIMLLQEAPRARLDICFIFSEIHHYFTVFGLGNREVWVPLREQRLVAKTSQKKAMFIKAFS